MQGNVDSSGKKREKTKAISAEENSEEVAAKINGKYVKNTGERISENENKIESDIEENNVEKILGNASEKIVKNNGAENAAGKKIRLQVFLAHSGVASRRAAEKIISAGRVSVNGKIITELGAKVTEKDAIFIDGKRIRTEEQKRYVLLNKPAGFVCSSSDEKGRAVAYDLLKEKYPERLYNVGRLDMYSKGMIIFTNDGDFAAKLSHPSSRLEKEYVAETSRDIPADFPKKFEKGLRAEGKFYKCVRCEILKPRKLKIVLIEGKNREIRNVLESQNIGTKSLVRVRIGGVKLDNLKPGDFRDLTRSEIQSLLKSCENKNF